MAAYDDSLINSEGQTWSLWAENIGFSSPNSDIDEEDVNKPTQEKTTTRLCKDEMSIFGYCPRWEDFYLVVCSICSQAVKPQALRQHIMLRHGEGEIFKLESGNCSRSSSSSKSNKFSKLKSNISIKFEEKINLQETFRENSLSPLDALTQGGDLQGDVSVNFKSEVKACNINISSFNRNSESVQSTGCDFLSVKREMSPLLQMNIKVEPSEDIFLQSHLSPSCSLPHRLPPPVPPEPQHILPPPSPHSGPPPSIGPPTPGSYIGPPTPGRGPPTPGRGPPTPGRGPPTPGRGPPTPGRGPPTPGMGPATPGMGPPTPGMGPPTPGMSPLTPNIGQTTGTLGANQSQGTSVGQVVQNHGQASNQCSLTPVYNAAQNIRSMTPTLGQNQAFSHIAQSPNLDRSVQSMATQNHPHGRPPTPGLSPIPSHLVSHVPLGHHQSMNLRAQSPNLNLLPQNVVSESMSGTCDQVRSIPLLTQEEARGSATRNNMSSPSVSSVEEEVNRISAMLMKEAEALTAPHYFHSSMHHSVSSHDIVEAQGLAGGGLRRGPLISNHMSMGSIITPNSKMQLSTPPPPSQNHSNSHIMNSSQPLGSVPVPMSSMSMATLKQIQADLLATVSESDLNAVLNATPDTTVLPSNSQVYRSGNNIHFSERNVITSEQYVETAQLGNHGMMQYNTENIHMPVIDQITDDMLADVERLKNIQTNSTQLIQDPFGSSQEILHYTESDKNAQNDELSRAVDSITKQLCQDSNSGSLESQLAGLLQQPPTSSNININNTHQTDFCSLNTPVSQGITVVIGSSHESNSTPVSLSLTSLAASLKKPSIVSSFNSGLMNRSSSGSSTGSMQGINTVELSSHDQINSQGQFSCNVTQVQEPCLSQTIGSHNQNLKIQTTQTSPYVQVQHRSQVQHISQQPNQYVATQTYTQQTQVQQPQQTYRSPTPLPIHPPPTPSPKKQPKKKKPGERKLLPLKDREYDPEIHCGVTIKDTGKPCTRSLTCKAHSLTLRRNVPGRSKKFDELLYEHKAAKEAQSKASKPSEAAANLVQSTPPRVPSGMSSGSTGGHVNGPTAHVASIVGTSSTSSPILVRTLGGTPTNHNSYVSHPDPSPTSSTYFQTMDPPSTPSSSYLQATPPSPAYWPSQRLAPPLSHSDNFFVRESPKPIAICSYNARRLGGYLSTDHKVDILRSALSSALKKPPPGLLSDTSLGSIFNNNNDRFNNVKPLLARKLQATIPSSSNCNKEGLSVGVGYNGHIQLNSSSGLIHTSALGAALKRPTQAEIMRHNSAVISAKNKSKKMKANEGGAINYVSNLVQLDASGNKNHFPVVTVSLPNGLTNPQAITLENVPIASVRNANNQSIRIHPPLTVRDAQITDRTNTGDSANIVLGSGIPGTTNFVIADTLKPMKNDVTGSIRIDGSKIISKGSISGTSSTGSISLLGSTSSLGGGTTTISNQNIHQPQGQSVYFTTIGPNNNTQLLQQLLNCRTIGKNTGMKLLSSNQGTVTGNRQTFLLQQEKEPS